MDDVCRVIEEIKAKLNSIKYDDPKLNNIRQNLSNDIIKYLNGVQKEQEKKEQKEEYISNISYKHSSKAPVVPTNYRLLKERKK